MKRNNIINGYMNSYLTCPGIRVVSKIETI